MQFPSIFSTMPEIKFALITKQAAEMLVYVATQFTLEDVTTFENKSPIENRKKHIWKDKNSCKEAM